MGRSGNRAAAVLAATGAVLALVGCTGLGGYRTMTVSSTATPPTSTATDTANGSEADDGVPAATIARLAILGRPFAASDALTADDSSAIPDTIVPNSQRRAGSADGTTYWIAAQQGGGACLVAGNPDPDSDMNFSVCAGAPLRRASELTSMQDERGHVVQLATDGYAPLESEGLRQIATNVWTG